MPDFDAFDQRRYPTLPVREGYAAWAPTYENTVEDVMDLALLDRIEWVPWRSVRRAADLGCGSGRTGQWLRARGEFPIDGVDLTPEMLDLARRRGVHDRLVEADARASGLDERTYDLVTCVLVDEHLAEVEPLYAEARRLLASGGTFVVVGIHPYFLMAVGMPTHFAGPGGAPVAIETHLHLPGEHLAGATAAGLVARELHEGLVDEQLIGRKPRWAPHRGVPFSYAWVWSLP
jgi:SAM-dependent methyltransferase